ncbi:SecDF P1 head subdomain-containing protein [Celeribacter sp.]|uniref:SecDF P1 head subdomain-containing protein n=1 Tax=Celeribacter sp. TaxID=1890673 RepID=UPI003A949C05
MRSILPFLFVAVISGCTPSNPAISFVAEDTSSLVVFSDQIKSTKLLSNEDPYTNDTQYVISIKLDDEAAQEFGSFSQDRVGETIDVRVCGVTVVSPYLHSAIYGGMFQITAPDQDEAKRIRSILLGKADCPQN